MANSIEISIDWAQFTIQEKYLATFFRFFRIDKTILYKGNNYFENSYSFLDTGRAYFGGETQKDNANIMFTGKTLTNFCDGNLDKIFALIKWVKDIDGKFTRLDIAYDDKNKIVFVSDIIKAWNKKNIVTKYREPVYIASTEYGFPLGYTGECFTLGKRTNKSTLMRAYNKALEQKLFDTHWTRLELETHRLKATLYAFNLCDLWFESNGNKEIISNRALAILKKHIDFVKYDDAINPTRRKPLSWWKKFTSNCNKFKATHTKNKSTFEKKEEWLRNSVSTSIALMSEGKGEEEFNKFISELVQRGLKKLNTEHLAMLDYVKKGGNNV